MTAEWPPYRALCIVLNGR